ncbi:radial spoke head protein 6 homolog A-like [Episyrphus balteatus]|uniref:radial spoke head protein 6 homolog A-like n=1 Tax=Episyrphus balteatus TaxID=286459 RepID=UPI0024859120|nr:radial spoke head protein 6 homolog A-like [Episyrphus balteatus]
MANSCASSNEYPSILSSVYSKINEAIRCKHCKCPSSCNSSKSSLEFRCPSDEVQEIDYKKFKTILQQSSSRSGDNLFDHLVEVIKRIIDERPVNVTDYFEQFSRNVRKNKLTSAIEPVEKPQFLERAKSFLEFIRSTDFQEKFSYIDEFEPFGESEMTIYQSSDSAHEKIQRTLLDNENFLQIQHFFGFCGIGLNIDEVFQLSLSVQKVQLHPNVENARFWGRIFGLHGSYYITEAVLTHVETANRLKAFKESLLEDMKSFISKKEHGENSVSSDSQLIPGSKWQNFPQEDLKKMQQSTEPTPKLQFEELFDAPEEPIGIGLNRKTYFVTTSLSEEWQELPTVAPRHVKASKKIKKYFTGDLNVDLRPLFPGSEKHYLRAMIARITSGTFIAPKNFYRRMSRKDKKLMEESEEVDEEDFESDEEGDPDNDDLITKNNDYKELSLEELTYTSNWVHVRPIILNQGRILHVNEKTAFENLEKKAILSMKGSAGIYEDTGEDEIEDEEILQEKEIGEEYVQEIGPELFSPCSKDKNKKGIPSWTSRYSSFYNEINQMIMMRSNLWPGAYSIAFENFSDCIYIGWGFKYVSRCISLEELPDVEALDYADTAEEITDPTVEMEEKWRQYHMKKALPKNKEEEMSDFSVEVDFDDED